MSLSEVRWLQQTEADVPQDDSWLSAAEAARLAGFRIPKRRCDWRLGRWTAKQAVAMYLGLPQDLRSLASIEIRPAPSGAPEVFISDSPAELAVSISHREGVAMCSVAAAGVQLGCDLELVEPHSQAFVRDYFTPEERAFLGDSSQERDRMVTLIWSAKESALKALRTGLRDDTRSVSVCAVDQPAGNGCWAQLKVHMQNGRVFEGWWQRSGRLVCTVVVTPAARLPMPLI